MTKANVYLNSFIAINTVIILAVLLTLIVPKWIFQNGIDNAPTFVNGMTTSIGIAVAFGGVITGFAFRELMKNEKPEFKIKFFEAMSLFLIPLAEAYVSYVLLAIGLSEYAVKFAIVGFLTALLITFNFFLGIAERLKLNKEGLSPSLPSQSPQATPETQSKDSENANPKDGDKTVNISINME